jgi:hypothetical protein
MRALGHPGAIRSVGLAVVLKKGGRARAHREERQVGASEEPFLLSSWGVQEEAGGQDLAGFSLLWFVNKQSYNQERRE